MKNVVPSGKSVEVDPVRVQVLGAGVEGPESTQGWAVDPQGPDERPHHGREQGQVPGGPGPDGWGRQEVDRTTVGRNGISESWTYVMMLREHRLK